MVASAAGSYLFAQGTWHGTDLANRINTVRIHCDVAARLCTMYQADLARGYLSVDSTSFRITHIDEKSLNAVNTLDLACVRQSLAIDRQAKQVSLIRTKINRDALCALIQDEPFAIYLGEPAR